MRNLKFFKVFIAFTTIINLVFLTGCWNYTEMHQQLNVSGIAIDKGQNGKKFHVSVEVITTGKTKDMQNSSEVIEADGDTVFQTVRSMIPISSKKLYFGHCKTLIIGEELARDGIADDLDFIYRDAEARISMNIIVTKDCNARDILNSKGVDNDIIAYEADDLIRTYERTATKPFNSQVYNTMNILQTEGKDLLLPAFEIDKVEGYETFKAAQAGVFKKDKLVGYINLDERQLYTIVYNDLNSGIINLKIPDQEDKYIAFEIYRSKSKYKPKEVNGKLTFTIKIKTDVFFGEMQTGNNYAQKSERKVMTKLLENQMKSNLEILIDKCQKEFNSDIFGIGRYIHNNEPELWQKYKDNWHETYKNLDINVDYKITIRGTGVGSSTIKTA